MATIIPPETRRRIKEIVKRTIRETIKLFSSSTSSSSTAASRSVKSARHLARLGTESPFFKALFPDWLLQASRFERSVSTKLGLTFGEIAKLLAMGSGRFTKAETEYQVKGLVSNAARSTIDSIVNLIRKKGCAALRRNYDQLATQVARSYRGRNGSTVTVVVDLYLRESGGTEWFFELKSPLPNKDQCLATTQKLLEVHAIRGAGAPRTKTRYAMTFNPFGNSRSDYNHSIAQKYLDMEKQVLIGEEFWDLLGGSGAFEELLRVYGEVGKKVAPALKSMFGL